MIGLRTQRSSAPTEGLEDVTAFPGPLKSISAREMEADKGDVSGTEERRNVEAHEDEGVCTAPPGLQCAEKRTELESEELLKLDSRNGGSGDVLTFSGPFDTIPVEEITADESDVFFTGENTNAGLNFASGTDLAQIGFGVIKAEELFHKIAALYYDRFKKEAVIDERMKE
ncbi:hypothetical protein TrST_g10962, partial [Triparma strigata]